MHKCAAQCCENEIYSIQKVHNCVENCSSSLNKAQQYVQGEFERVQVVKFNLFNYQNYLIISVGILQYIIYYNFSITCYDF